MVKDIAAWREGLLQRVHFEKDKVLLNEAINCYIGKCYRAGYIVSWLSIMESLRNKIKELAITGNVQAEISLKNIEKDEDALRSNDHKIIEESLNCGFITRIEKEEILFLWSQRCKFAHPYYLAPEESELIFIIEKSLSLALSKQIIFKKDYIDALIVDICDTSHFIKDDHGYVVNHAMEKLSRIDRTLHSYFFKTLFFKFSEAFDKNSAPNIVKRIDSYLMQILIENGNVVNSEGWRLEEWVTKFPDKFCLLINKETWALYNDRIKDICTEYVKSEAADELMRLSRRRFKYLIKKGRLEDRYKKDFYEFLAGIPIEIAGEFYQSGDEDLFDRLKDLICSSGYYENEVFFGFLYTHEGKEFLSALDDEGQEDMAQWIIMSAARNSYAAMDFIRSNFDNIDLFCHLIKACFYVDPNSIEFFKQMFDAMQSRMEHSFDDKLMEKVFEQIRDKILKAEFFDKVYLNGLATAKKSLEQKLATEIERPYVKQTLEVMLAKVNERIVKQNAFYNDSLN